MASRRRTWVVLALLAAGAALQTGRIHASDAGAPRAGAAETPGPSDPTGTQERMPSSSAEGGLGGFVLEDLRVARDEVVPGGPGRDDIRSVDAPRFAPIDEARWVRADTPVIGVSVGDTARAYPVHVMEWHQVVNDRFGDVPVVVTYDPITDLAGAWRWPSGVPADTFGVSGLLDRDGFLLYDRGTSSLWSSATGRAISGARAGQALRPLRVRVETLARWLERHPDTRVLALPERRRIDYRRSPYSAYWISEAIPLAVRARDDRFHPKEVVLGVEHGDRSRAYVGSILTRAGGRIVDDFASHRLRIAYMGDSGTFVFEAPEEIRVRSAYWFAWKSLHPDTEIWGEDLARERPSGAGEPADSSPEKEHAPPAD